MTGPDDRMLRLGGAALVLAGGAIHVVLAFDGYGTASLEDAFLLNGAVAAIVAVAVLLAPGPVPALAGMGHAGASLLALALSRIGDGVVGFRGTGFEPVPEMPLTILVELATLAVLGALAVRDRQPLVALVRSARA